MKKEKAQKEDIKIQKNTNVRSYFTKELDEKVAVMTEKEMEGLMKEIETTDYWVALLRYRSSRMPILDAMLRGTNPHIDPHQISWAQGCMAGMCEIENEVIRLNAPTPVEEKQGSGEGPRTEGVIMGE